jgi:uncharacterized membrane-anchored protein YhcB (DUF1043 family)
MKAWELCICLIVAGVVVYLVIRHYTKLDNEEAKQVAKRELEKVIEDAKPKVQIGYGPSSSTA